MSLQLSIIQSQLISVRLDRNAFEPCFELTPALFAQQQINHLWIKYVLQGTALGIKSWLGHLEGSCVTLRKLFNLCCSITSSLCCPTRYLHIPHNTCCTATVSPWALPLWDSLPKRTCTPSQGTHGAAIISPWALPLCYSLPKHACALPSHGSCGHCQAPKDSTTGDLLPLGALHPGIVQFALQPPCPSH